MGDSDHIRLGASMTDIQLITPRDGEDFIVRFAVPRMWTEHVLTMPYVTSDDANRFIERLRFDLVDGVELDELICTAFDCDDVHDSFRGRLRHAVGLVKPDVLVHLCAYRMGWRGDTSETADLSLLVGVLPDTTSLHDAMQMIEKLRQVLYEYDERLGNLLAIEVVELSIGLAVNPTRASWAEAESFPNEDVRLVSCVAAVKVGASVGPRGDDNKVGTLGPVFRICERGEAGHSDQYYAMTCSHVMSDSKDRTIPAYSPDIGQQQVAVSPADRDNFHWWARAQKRLLYPKHFSKIDISRELDLTGRNRTLGWTYAASGISSSLKGQYLIDAALIKIDEARRGNRADQLSNIVSMDSQQRFIEHQLLSGSHPEFADIDWLRPANQRYLTEEDIQASIQNHRDRLVFKLGRTTGHTTGRIHRIYPSLTVDHHLTAADGSKRTVTVKGKALVVVKWQWKIFPVFAAQGDSGALVVNKHGQGVGTVSAMDDAGSAYVTPLAPSIDFMREVIARGRNKPVSDIEIEYL